MFPTNRTVRARTVFTFLAAGLLMLSLSRPASGANLNEDRPAVSHHKDISKLQEILRDKGYYGGQIDGVIGPQTRAGIRRYQKSEGLPVTGRLDAETAGKLGVGPESVGGNFKGAGQEVGAGGKELAHEIKKGKPIAAGKEMGKGLGRAGGKVGRGIKKAVTTDSDRGDREKKVRP